LENSNSQKDPADPINYGSWAMVHGTKTPAFVGPSNNTTPVTWVLCSVNGLNGMAYVPVYQ
jgi:hypothetical protein